MSYRSRSLTLSLLAALLLGGTLGGWWYRTTRPGYRMQRGREAVRQKDWERARSLVDWLEASGEADLARLLDGESLLAQGRPGDALRELNRIRDEGALRLRGAALSGRCLLELQELREAHRVFSWVLEQDPDNVDAQRGMAALHYDLGNLDQAVQRLAEVARLDPADGRPHLLSGVIHSDMGQNEQAEEDFRRALRCELSEAFRSEVRLELAACLKRRAGYEAALEQLDLRPEAKRGEGEKARAVRAECLWGLNRRKELEALLDRTLVRHPRQWQLLLLRGRLHLEARRPVEAVESLERAAEAAPREYDCRYHLALAYTAAGRPAEAVEQQKRAAALKGNLDRLTELTKEAMRRPGDAAVRRELARVCDEMQKDKLAAMWRRAAEACRADATDP